MDQMLFNKITPSSIRSYNNYIVFIYEHVVSHVTINHIKDLIDKGLLKTLTNEQYIFTMSWILGSKEKGE